jgi:four helix bundle protein
MRFEVLEISVQLVDALRPLMVSLGRRDVDLARQVKRAGSSVTLNIGEGRQRIGRDRLHAYRIAAGSADEVRVALRMAVAWGDLAESDVTKALALCDRVVAILWRLTHPKPRT